MLPDKETIVRKGFTLMELLVVIAVIGLLSSIIFAITRGADEQGRIAKGLQFGQHLQNSLGSYAVGIWSFDEGSGSTANDISGWGNNGTLVNSPTWRCASTDTSYTPSAQGCSLEFNGSSNYVNAGNGTSLNITSAVTMEAWIKKPDYSRTVDAIIRKSGSYVLYFAGASDGEPQGLQTYFWGLANPRLGYSYTNFMNDRWYHVVGTYNGSVAKLYVNGAEVASENKTGNLTITSNNVAIGASSENEMYFSGLIDEARIYETALTLSHVQSLYYAGLDKLLGEKQISEQEYQQHLAKN
jgi:prepilin-type N-terminal cleavage/methylation domain-containing protein